MNKPNATRASEKVTVRLGAQRAAAESRMRKLGHATLSEYLRALVEADTGLAVDLKPGGFANMSAGKLAKAQSAGGKARAAAISAAKKPARKPRKK